MPNFTLKSSKFSYKSAKYAQISCDVPAMGAASGYQIHNGLCVLSQNVINEKMYLGRTDTHPTLYL